MMGLVGKKTRKKKKFDFLFCLKFVFYMKDAEREKKRARVFID